MAIDEYDDVIYLLYQKTWHLQAVIYTQTVHIYLYIDCIKKPGIFKLSSTPNLCIFICRLERQWNSRAEQEKKRILQLYKKEDEHTEVYMRC